MHRNRISILLVRSFVFFQEDRKRQWTEEADIGVVILDDRMIYQDAKSSAKGLSVNFRFWDYLNGLLMATQG